MRTTTSNTIGLGHLRDLLREVPEGADLSGYASAIVEENVLGRPSAAGRKRTLRHLRELYLLDPARPEFLVLRRLWDADPTAQPLLACLLAFTRDELLRDSFVAVREASLGSVVTSIDLAAATGAASGSGLSPATLAKVGRNTGSCWTQTGHLTGHAVKRRTTAIATPASVAYAVFLGYLCGLRGFLLLDTPWTALLDVDAKRLRSLIDDAARAGFLSVRSAGQVLDIDVGPLLGDAGGA